ncbi:hypothetical protein DZF91_20580 [Actinomadura logoneensis]|uniref:Uncharacterized protein n=1 Tax=Actinomadura logoneensis TaxID=2293572 RepID=A0A372JIP4_9ACTN|nr:DUF5313 family protein [Actinomadura logoneensis]RFU39789.1 hypothetical protein DZF91_20580 [Actinomadura logoneensis]
MTRLPGDPGPLGRVRYTLGFRLPPENREWVRHDLTDVGWRARLLLRHVALMIPVCLTLCLLPGPWWLRGMVALLAFLASTLTVAVSSDDLRRARLHRHGLEDPRGERR